MAGFMHMPAEIRNMLYHQILQTSEPYESFPSRSNQFALFAVSNQVHNESTSLFYQQKHIAIDASSPATHTATLLPPIADKYLRFIRRLTVYALTGQATLPSVQKAASTIASLSMMGANFNQLNISVSSTLSHLLNSRVDDSIMDSHHPITLSLERLLESQVAESVTIEVKNSWFAPGLARAFASKYGSRLQFLVSGAPTTDFSSIERPLTGRYSNSHLISLDLAPEDLACIKSDIPTSVSSSPSSLPSSRCSAFASLDTFSVTSFEMSSDEEAERDGESIDEYDTGERPFFGEDDIEEWQASQMELDQESVEEPDDLNDLDEDEEMEDIPHDDAQSFINNLEQVAHHLASEEDLTYLANFAPDLLLTRHHLSYLV